MEQKRRRSSGKKYPAGRHPKDHNLKGPRFSAGLSVPTNPRIRCQACASVLTNFNIRSAPMLGLPRLQGFSITLKG
ncbi:hypothetical protein AAGG52_04025 [Bacillus licheniformis]